MNRVLILEDEGVLRASMSRGIAKLPGIEVVDAGTFAEALRFIDEKPPKLILSDLDLPDRSGLELLGALGARGLRIPIVYITAYLKAYGSQIPPHANVEVREKPIALDELRKLVKVYLEDSGSSPFSVTDYLQIASMGSHSVEITMERDDGRAGRIIVFGGTLWSSFDEQGAGRDAFKRLAMLQDAFITCNAVRREPGERNIYESLEHLLLEAAQHFDEEVRDGGHQAAAPAPAPEPEPEPPPPPPPSPPPPPPKAEAKPEPKPAPPPVMKSAPPKPEPPVETSVAAKKGLVFKAPGFFQEEPPAPAAASAPASASASAPAKEEDFDTLWQRASEALLDKNYEEALDSLRKAQALRPDDPKVTKYIEKLSKKKT